MKTIEILAAELAGDRWAVLSSTAKVDEFDMEQFKVWKIAHKPVRVPTILETMNSMDAKPGTPLFELEYQMRFAQAHIVGVIGPVAEYTSESPDAAFIEGLPVPILNAFAARVDNSRGVTPEEYDSLKKQTAPDGNSSTGEVSETQSN